MTIINRNNINRVSNYILKNIYKSKLEIKAFREVVHFFRKETIIGIVFYYIFDRVDFLNLRIRPAVEVEFINLTRENNIFELTPAKQKRFKLLTRFIRIHHQAFTDAENFISHNFFWFVILSIDIK